MKKILWLLLLIPVMSFSQTHYIRGLGSGTSLPTVDNWDGRFFYIDGNFYIFQRGGWYIEKIDTAYNIDSLKAMKLITPRNINGVPFDGTQDITISAGSVGSLFELDSQGNTRPKLTVTTDASFELDSYGNIRPKL